MQKFEFISHKKLVALVLFVVQSSYIISNTIELPLYKETEILNVYCMPIDQSTADAMITSATSFAQQLSIDFNHQLSKTPLYYIYPDLATFHQAINWPDAPDWIIGNANTDDFIRKMVSPRNPGPAHSYESIMLSVNSGIVLFYINDKYNDKEIPHWFRMGISLYKAHYYAEKIYATLIQHIASLPTIDQLEAIRGKDTLAFDQLHGFHVSYAIIEFIDQHWGWQTILALLEDYAQFEEILKMDKKTFREQWITFFLDKYKN